MLIDDKELILSYKFSEMNHRLKKYIFFAIVTLFSSLHPLNAFCATIELDSLEISPRESDISSFNDSLCEKFNSKQLIVPGVLMVSGLVGAIDYNNSLNHSVNDAFTDLSNGKTCKIDDYLRFLPSVSHLFLGSVGVKSKHNFKERLLISATSHAAMLIMGYGCKFVIHEQRPDLSNNHSFPSGHVALAFTGAELLRQEYGTSYGIAGYAVATSVALLRLYNNKHWLNDVLMGAGIGILSARIGCWLLPVERKLFKMNNKSSKSSTFAITPTYNVGEKAPGVAVYAIF
ncbi:MAG: phosphatase PAP2 family protein [Muribaculaceae bacterium]|nr:phosphatase PAP2 family protein [Muribaculaceae bacterium]